MLELHIPNDQILLSDFHMWHCVLNNWFLGTEENDVNGANHTQKEITESWQNIFSLKPFPGWTINGKIEDIQAVFWKLDMAHVNQVWHYTGRRKTF